MAEDKSPVQLAVEQLEGKMAAFKTEVQTKATEEINAAKTELTALKTQMDAATAKATEQGATIIQLKELQEDWKKRAGRHFSTNGAQGIKTLEAAMSEVIVKNAKDFDAAGAEDSPQNKAKLNYQIKVSDVLSSSMTTTNASPYASFLDWRPGMEPTGQTRFRDLVRTIPSAYDTVYFPRANSPIGGGSFSRQTTEGVAKSQVDRGYTMIPLTLRAFAGWINVSRQALRNIPFLQGWLPTSLQEQLMDMEDVYFSTTLTGAATGPTSTTGIGSDTNAIAKIVIGIKNLIKTKFVPTAVAVDPDVWGEMLITRATTSGDYSLPDVVSISPNGTVQIMGRPIYPVNWLAGRRIIIGDWTKAAIIESEGLTFRQTDSNASLFVANELTFLLERVEELAQFRLDAFSSFTV